MKTVFVLYILCTGASCDDTVIRSHEYNSAVTCHEHGKDRAKDWTQLDPENSWNFKCSEDMRDIRDIEDRG